MNLTLFSVEEANRAAAEIRPSLERLVKAKSELDRVQRRIEVLTLALSGATAGNPDAVTLRQLTERCNRLAGELSRGVAAIQRRGCLVKDLERGLIDFYSISGDRLVFLCWHLGESEVSHWHTLEGGFAGRQPLNQTEHE